MRITIYVRLKGKRTYASQGTYTPEEARAASSAAYKLAGRGGDVFELTHVDTAWPPPTFLSNEREALAERTTEELVTEAWPRAEAVVEQAIAERKFEAGTDRGLALAVARIVRSRGLRGSTSTRYELFGTAPITYSVSLY